MAIFAEFAACKYSGASAESAEAQALVICFRRTLLPITVLAKTRLSQVLAKMYICDERFKKNIDEHGEGTANVRENLHWLDGADYSA